MKWRSRVAFQRPAPSAGQYDRVMNVNFSDDERHAATLEVLREALDFLQRLPNVPVTREFCSKLQAHLDDPTNRLIARVEPELLGQARNAAGLPLLECSVIGNRVTVRVPDSVKGTMRVASVREVSHLVAQGGITISLTRANSHRE